MKTQFYSAIIFAASFAFYNKINAQANQQLSNLTSPTAVNVSLIPGLDKRRDLGSPGKSWRYLYLDSVIYFGGTKFIAGLDHWNTSVGSAALNANTLGYRNAAVGFRTLYLNTEGYDNSAIGFEALYSNTTGAENSVNGAQALNHNTTGYDNTANGFDALNQNKTGHYDAANGAYALFSNTTGSNNTASGYEALYNDTTGFYNTADGSYAGFNTTIGSHNTFIGFSANCGSQGKLTNSTAIGNEATVSVSNTVRIGDAFVTSIGGYVNWSNVSDGRVKKNIKQNVPGLSFINKLNPITYNLDLDAADRIVQRPAMKDKDGNIIQPSAEEITSRKEKEQNVYTGFIAQDVEKAAKELNYDFSGVDAAKNDHDLYGLRYAEFVVPLVKAVQELSSQNDDLKNQNNQLATKVDDLQKQIDELKSVIVSEKQQAYTNDQQVSLSSPLGAGASSLSQNVPNPFNHTTTINYTLPQQYSSAKIIVVDELGRTIKSINLPAGRQGLSGNGKGSISFSSPFRAGASYQYSLYVNGKLIDTKQMVLNK